MKRRVIRNLTFGLGLAAGSAEGGEKRGLM
jgi:hypothetical protein